MAEINPRKQSSTPQSMFLLAPELNLGELELRAIRDGTFGRTLTDMPPLKTCCAYKETKARDTILLNGIVDNGTGRNVFASGDGARLLTSYLPGTTISAGETIGGILSVNESRDEVQAEIENLERMIQSELKIQDAV